MSQFMAKRIVFGLIAGFILYFFFLASARHDNYYSLRLDLGNMYQTVWNVAHGYGFTLTDPYGKAQVSRLSFHADFLLIFIAPLWFLWKDPKMLLFVQTCVTGFGALAVYIIASRRFSHSLMGVLFAVLYVLYPPLERIMLHDFHAEALSTAFLLFSYVWLTQRRTVLFIIFGLLAAASKEQVWLVVAILSIFGVWKQYIPRFYGAVYAFVCIVIFYLLFWHSIPQSAQSGSHFALLYLSQYGTTPGEIVKNILLRPGSVVSMMVSLDRLQYIFRLLLPVGFLSVFAPVYLLPALPSFLLNIISSSPFMRIIDYQYTSTITPFVFIAAIEGLFRLKKNVPAAVLACVVSVFALYGSYAWGELPYGKESRFRYFTTPPREKQTMQRVEQTVHPMYTVSASNNIGAHYAGRRVLYPFPVGAFDADVVVVRLGDRFAWPSGAIQEATVSALLKHAAYALVEKENNFYVFQRVERSQIGL